eukprot:13396740-Alexandrium_andersonii.AAC.1
MQEHVYDLKPIWLRPATTARGVWSVVSGVASGILRGASSLLAPDELVMEPVQAGLAGNTPCTIQK